MQLNSNKSIHGGFGEEMEDSIEMAPANLEENLGARWPNALKILENDNVGFNFQLKMLEFMDFMNQELKCGHWGFLKQNNRVPHETRC